MTKPKLITWRNESRSLKDWARLMQMTEKKMRLFFKHSMTNNIDADTAKLQKKWDIFLITNYYENPGSKILAINQKFKDMYSVSNEQFKELLRTTEVMNYKKGNLEVYSFVALHLKKLHRVLDRHDISDVFMIASNLYNSAITVNTKISKKDKDYLNEVDKRSVRKLSRAAGLASYEVAKHNLATSRNAWGITK